MLCYTPTLDLLAIIPIDTLVKDCFSSSTKIISRRLGFQLLSRRSDESKHSKHLPSVRAAFSSYENVELPVQEPDYDIPRQHSSGRAYENVQLATSASPATTTAAPEASTTPPTPTTPMTPPTPDHPPPPAHQAEQRIHDCILPLTQVSVLVSHRSVDLTDRCVRNHLRM